MDIMGAAGTKVLCGPSRAHLCCTVLPPGAVLLCCQQRDRRGPLYRARGDLPYEEERDGGAVRRDQQVGNGEDFQQQLALLPRHRWGLKRLPAVR